MEHHVHVFVFNNNLTAGMAVAGAQGAGQGQGQGTGNVQRMTQVRSFLGAFLAMEARIASSKTPLRPSCVRAEHSI